MNIGLELQVFSLSDADLNTPEGIEISLKDCVLIPYTFYSIDYVTRDRQNPRLTVIGSGGEDFTVNATYDAVKKKIEQIRTLRFN
jgi:hypothetical protein